MEAAPPTRNTSAEPRFGWISPCGLNYISATGNFGWFFTAGEDGNVRRFDFYASINGDHELPRSSPLQSLCCFGGVLLATWSPLHSTPTALRCVVPHSQGLWAVSGNASGQIMVSTVRLSEGSNYYHVQAHQDSVSDLTLIPGERQCISVGWDACISLHNLDLGQSSIIQGGARSSVPGTGHKGPITAAGMQPASGINTLLTSSLDGTARLWDLRTTECGQLGKFASTTDKPLSPMLDAKWHHAGNLAYTAHKDGSVLEWDVRQPQESVRRLHLPPHSGTASSLCVLEEYIACGSSEGSLLLYDMGGDWGHDTQYQLLLGQRGQISSILTDPERRFLIVASGTKGASGAASNCCLGYDLTDLLNLEPSELEMKTQ